MGQGLTFWGPGLIPPHVYARVWRPRSYEQLVASRDRGVIRVQLPRGVRKQLAAERAEARAQRFVDMMVRVIGLPTLWLRRGERRRVQAAARANFAQRLRDVLEKSGTELMAGAVGDTRLEPPTPADAVTETYAGEHYTPAGRRAGD